MSYAAASYAAKYALESHGCHFCCACVCLQKVRDCLRTFEDYSDLYQGLHAYLLVMSRYHYAFQDDTLPFEMVIENLAFVMFFIRYWNAYLAVTCLDSKLRRQRGLTRQTTLHIEISCAGVMNSLGVLEHFKICEGQPIALGNMVRPLHKLLAPSHRN